MKPAEDLRGNSLGPPMGQNSTKRKYQGDRLLPLREVGNSISDRYEASLVKQDLSLQSAQEAILFEAHHNIPSKTLSLGHQQNLSGTDSQQILIEEEAPIEPPIMSYSQRAQQLESQNALEELQDYSSIRYKETRRHIFREQFHHSQNACPYQTQLAMDAVGILHEYRHHLLHWSSKNLCAVGIQNKVYLLDLVEDRDAENIDVCHNSFRVTALRWLEPSDSLTQQPQVLAVATNDPLQRLSIWDAQRKIQIRRINSTQEVMTALSFNEKWILSSTLDQHLVINDVSVRQSEILKMRVPEIGAIRHCAFSNDFRYISACGDAIAIFKFAVNSGGNPELSQHLCTQKVRFSKINQVEWSYHQPFQFAFCSTTAIPCQLQPLQEVQGLHSPMSLQMFKHEVKIFNVNTKQEIASIALNNEATCLLWSRYQRDRYSCQRLLAGLSNGQIAVIGVQGMFSVTAYIQSYTYYVEQPIMYLQESADCSQIMHIDQCQILYVWKRVERDVSSNVQSKARLPYQPSQCTIDSLVIR